MIQKLVIFMMLLTCSALAATGCTDFSAALEEAKEGVDQALSETEYKAQMGANAVECSTLMNQVAEEYEAVDLADESWRDSIGEHCDEIHEMYEEAQDMELPEGMEEDHEIYVEALEHFDLAADYIEAGLEADDEDMIALAEAEALDGIEALEEYAETLDEEWLNELLANTEGFSLPIEAP